MISMLLGHAKQSDFEKARECPIVSVVKVDTPDMSFETHSIHCQLTRFVSSSMPLNDSFTTLATSHRKAALRKA